MDSKPIKVIIEGLHKRRAVRRPDLVNFVRRALETWRMPPAVDLLVLRVRLIHHLTEALAELGDKDLMMIGRAAYNIDRDPSMSHRDLKSRLEELDKQADLSIRTSQRRLRDTIIPRVVAALERPLRDIPQDILNQAVHLEREFAKRGADTRGTPDKDPPADPVSRPVPHSSGNHEALQRAIRGLYIPPLSESIEQFIASEVITPQGAGPGLIVTRTARAGYWVCTFTSLELLHAHATASGIPWAAGRERRTTGGDLIRRVLSLPLPTGVLLDPPADARGDVSRTLPLPADRIRAIAKTL